VFIAVDFNKPRIGIDFFSKAVLKSIKWDSGKSLDRVTSHWFNYVPNHMNDMGLVNRKRLKKTEFTFDNYLFQGYLVQFEDNKKYQMSFSLEVGDEKYLANKDNLNSCQRQVDDLVKRLGPATKIVDTSDSDFEKDYASAKIQSQWDFFDTRLTFDCLGLKILDGYLPMALMVVGHKDDIAPLHDPIYLACSHNYKFVGSLREKGVDIGETINVTINPNVKSIDSSTHNLGRVVTFTDREIVSKVEDKKLLSVFRLDRIMGNYTWDARLAEDKSSGIDRWGDCTRIDLNSRL
jgi:hypothetical protein